MNVVLSRQALELSNEAIEAIHRGIERGDSLAEIESSGLPKRLQYLGLPQRTINALEESQFRITTLEQLMNCTVAELDTIANVGERAIRQILNCIEQYDKLEEVITSYESAI
jgi:NAD-dependent DNA ligase